MNVPEWMQDVIAEFGRSAGISALAFNENDVAALGFESGARLVFEYAYSSLVVMMTVPVESDPASVKRVLAVAAPWRRGEFRVKSGLLPSSGRAFFAVRLPHGEVSLPVVNAAFMFLRGVADQFGEGAV